ncbi:MAG: two-component regulator propeller domain-containing protein, partial [Lysobacteraceae bacterium]
MRDTAPKLGFCARGLRIVQLQKSGIVRLGYRTVGRAPWRACACAILLLLAQSATADVRTFNFQHVTGEHGLAQNTVSALLQDREGYVWVATQGGLHRYDGQDYRQFAQVSNDPASLPDNLVTSLAEGDPGTLWVGTNSAYVAQLDLASGRFRRLLPADLDHPGEPGKHVLALYYQHGHGLWVSTEGGIDLIDPASGLRRSVLRQPTSVTLQSSFGFATDPSGALWATLPSGLYRIDPVTLTTRRVSNLPGISDILRDRHGRMWVAADGLYRLDPANGQLLRVDKPQAPAADADWPHRLAEDRQGRLWLATSHSGLVRYDPDSGARIAVRASNTLTDSLPEDTLTTLMVDHSGLLWVGTQSDGVVLTDPAGSRFDFVVDPDNTLRSTNNVRSLYQTPDGALWIGTDGAGVKRYDLATDRFTSYLPQLRAAMNPELATHDVNVIAVRPAGAGALWIATNLGLYKLDLESDRVYPQDLLADNANPEAQVFNVRALANASDGGLWVGTQTRGLIKLDASGRPVLRIGAGGANGLSNAMVNSLYEDPKGILWIGTMDGLDSLHPADHVVHHYLNDPHDPATLSGNRVRVIVAARDGGLWVGTHSGLNRVQSTPGGSVRIRRYPIGDDNGTIYGIVEDARGRLWLSGNNGLLRLDPSTGALHRFTVNDGLQNPEFNGGAYLQLQDGRLAFGGIRGLNLFNPALIVNSTYAPPVVLTSARIGSDTSNRVGMEMPAQLQLRQSDSVLRLHFGALDYAAPGNIAYRYRLEGFDQDWIDADHHPDATYTNLDAGHYVFHAQASNHDGEWSVQELQIPITVIPPWWNSWWSRLVYALIALVAIAIGWRNLQQRRNREAAYNREIQQREQQLKMALWGSGDDFWDLDIRTQTLRRSTASASGPQSPNAAMSVAQWRSDVVHPDDLEAVDARLNQHITGVTDHFESEHRIRHPRTGEWIMVLARGKVVERDDDGTPLCIAGTARDVSQMQHDVRERLIAGEVLRSMTEAVSVIDLDFDFVSVNRAFTLTTGYTEDQVVGQPSSMLDSSQHSPEFYRQMRETMAQEGRWSGEVWQRRKDGEEFLCAIEAVEVLEPNGERGHFVVVINDITEKKRAEQELRYLANFDTLTGLPNRALLSERLARAIVRARRHDTMVAVLFLDLDRFKEINDSLGHTAGDRILKAVAARLQTTANPTDTVSRLGGDEFTVVVEDIVSEEQAFEVARKILIAFTQPLLVDERSEISITPSIG